MAPRLGSDLGARGGCTHDRGREASSLGHLEPSSVSHCPSAQKTALGPPGRALGGKVTFPAAPAGRSLQGGWLSPQPLLPPPGWPGCPRQGSGGTAVGGPPRAPRTCKGLGTLPDSAQTKCPRWPSAPAQPDEGWGPLPGTPGHTSPEEVGTLPTRLCPSSVGKSG